MFKFLLPAIIGCALSLNVWAQFSVTGFVRDAKTTEPLVGATVRAESQNRYAVTDEHGKFELKNVSSGTQTFVVKFLGYQELVHTENLSADVEIDFKLEESNQLTDEVVVSATRANEKSPTVYSTIGKAAIQKQNLGQDLPFLLNWTPSLITTSDAGAGIGYTGLRIRGSDATRINVTINGIPLNDSEEHGVFWVNIPDIASSTQSIQVQRGVGNSTNGAGAFGASINLQTNTRNDLPYADVINSIGSFGTHRHTLGIGTGLKSNFAFDARMSLIKSDGFIDRASSDLKSYYLSGGYYGKKTMVKAIVFGGKEITYQSWNGVPESKLNNDAAAMDATIADAGWNAEQIENFRNSNSRTFNLYTYKNQVDNYSQDHYQLHVSHRFNNTLTANVALHYTYGRGYFEEFKYNDGFSKYGFDTLLIDGAKIGSSDLVRRRWLDNHFYGTTYSLHYEKGKINSTLGGALNRYVGDHFGEVIWTQVSAIPQGHRYYFNQGTKTDFNIFSKTNYQLAEQLNLFADLQLRTIRYRADGVENELNEFKVKEDFNFFNPKFGLTYSLSTNQNVYASFSVANREPVRSDFVNSSNTSTPRHETLYDWEAGWRLKKRNASLNVNLYWMDYANQLVPTGRLNDVGAAIRANVGSSYRAGVEVDGGVRINSKLSWMGNVTFSQNKINEFVEVIYDYGAAFDEYKELTNVYRNTDIALSPNWIGGSTLIYQAFKNFEAALLSKYVGKQYLDNTSNSSRAINSYFVNDVRLSYTWKPNFMRELSVSCLINNVLDEWYSSNGYTYGYFAGPTETRQNYFYPQAGRNFLAMVAMRF
jgi:iron complex outermembrane recepter protein